MAAKMAMSIPEHIISIHCTRYQKVTSCANVSSAEKLVKQRIESVEVIAIDIGW